MRIFLINEIQDWGGGEAHTLDLALGLSESDEVHVVGNPGSQLLDRCRQAGLKVIPVAMRSEMDVLAVSHLRRLFVDLQPDVVAVHTMRDHVLASAAASLARPHPPLVRTQHIHFPTDLSLLARRAYGNGTDQVICVSEYIRKNVASVGNLPASRLSIVHHGIDFERFARPRADQALEFRQSLGFPPEVTIVGMLGSLFATKGHATLLDAAALLPDPVVVVMVGDGPRREALEYQAAELGVRERVRFVGFVDDPVVAWHAFDIAVVPSVWEEPAGLVVLEAQAAGKPLVASRVGGIPEMVLDGKTGILIKPGDARELADKIRGLFENPSLSRSMGAAGPPWVQAHFTRPKMLESTRRIYEQAIAAVVGVQA